MRYFLLLAAISMGCSHISAWYEEQWRKDGPCLHYCAALLDINESFVMATRNQQGSCICMPLDPPIPEQVSCPQGPCRSTHGTQ